MTSETLLKIAKGFDNVHFVQVPILKHFWIDNCNSLQSTEISMVRAKFKFNELLDYVELEQSKGHSVYILDENPIIMYVPFNFEPIISLNIQSVFGIISKMKEKNINEELTTSDFNKFKYLLIR